MPYLAEPTDESPAPVAPAAMQPQLPHVSPDLSLVQRNRPRGYPPSHFADLWAARRRALAAGDAARARTLLTQLVVEKAEAGWPNMFAVGEALIRESRAAHRAAKTSLAVELGEAAVQVAPDLPQTHLALADVLWNKGGAYGQATAQLFSAGWLHLREPPLRRALFGNVTVAAMIALLIAAVLFSFAVLYRHVRMLSHDLHHVLVSVGGRWLAHVVAVALVFSPLIFGLGPLWALLAWAGLLAFYFDARERIGAVLALAYASALPLLLSWMLLYVEAPASRSQRLYDAARDMMATEAAAALESGDSSAEARYVLGMRARWSGDLAQASQLLAAAAERGARDPELFVVLGNVRFWLADAAGAVEAYRRAIASDPDDAIAYFNLSRVYYALTEHQKAGEAFRHASAIDYEAIEAYSEQAKKEGPGFVVSPAAARRLLAQSVEPTSLHEQAGMQLWQWVGGATRPLFFTFYGIATTMLVILLGWLRRLLVPSRPCQRCGQAACRRCNPELPDQHQCGQCYHAFVADDDVDAQVKIQKEIEVRRYQARTRRVRQVSAVLLVGMPQVIRGDTVWGLIWTTVTCTLGILLCGALGWLPVPVLGLAGGEALARVVVGVALAIVYGLGVWRGLREESSWH